VLALVWVDDRQIQDGEGFNMVKRKSRQTDPVLKQLEQIKCLLILELIAAGVRAKDIASVLGMDKSDLSRLVPARAIGKLRNNDNA
jgi:hypothetical protein